MIVLNQIIVVALVVAIVILIIRNRVQEKEIRGLNSRMAELEVRIVVRLEDRVSSNEESIQILEHAHSLNAVLMNGQNSEQQ